MLRFTRPMHPVTTLHSGPRHHTGPLSEAGINNSVTLWNPTNYLVVHGKCRQDMVLPLGQMTPSHLLLVPIAGGHFRALDTRSRASTRLAHLQDGPVWHLMCTHYSIPPKPPNAMTKMTQMMHASESVYSDGHINSCQQ